MPPIRPWEKKASGSSRAAEQEVLRSVQAVQRLLSGPPVDFLGDIFDGGETFVRTNPEFDPYRALRESPT